VFALASRKEGKGENGGDEFATAWNNDMMDTFGILMHIFVAK